MALLWLFPGGLDYTNVNLYYNRAQIFLLALKCGAADRLRSVMTALMYRNRMISTGMLYADSKQVGSESGFESEYRCSPRNDTNICASITETANIS